MFAAIQSLVCGRQFCKPGIVGFFEGMRYLFMSMDDFYDMYYQGNRR